jgi:hypothetical protein
MSCSCHFQSTRDIKTFSPLRDDAECIEHLDINITRRVPFVSSPFTVVSISDPAFSAYARRKQGVLYSVRRKGGRSEELPIPSHIEDGSYGARAL